MTRAAKSYIPAGPVFCHRIGTFHKTWLEKTVADRDPQFRKPKVPAALKDVQALCYYDVEPVRTVFGTTFYRNTFMGQTVGYCIRRAGITYHDDDFDDLIPGWKRKWKEMQRSGQEPDPQQTVDARYLKPSRKSATARRCMPTGWNSAPYTSSDSAYETAQTQRMPQPYRLRYEPLRAGSGPAGRSAMRRNSITNLQTC